MKILIASLVVGLLLSFISWGDENGFHGKGFPFAIVYWEKGKDFNNYFAPFFNIVTMLIMLIILFHVIIPIIRSLIFRKN